MMAATAKQTPPEPVYLHRMMLDVIVVEEGEAYFMLVRDKDGRRMPIRLHFEQAVRLGESPRSAVL